VWKNFSKLKVAWCLYLKMSLGESVAGKRFESHFTPHTINVSELPGRGLCHLRAIFRISVEKKCKKRSCGQVGGEGPKGTKCLQDAVSGRAAHEDIYSVLSEIFAKV
jgi:hypothetical protein